jgi:hypothetical protein
MKRFEDLILSVVEGGKTIAYVAKKHRVKYAVARRLILEYEVMLENYDKEEASKTQRDSTEPKLVEEEFIGT